MGILLSGPAGSAKSAVARGLLQRASGLTVAADFQSIVAALLLLNRGPDGKFPLRPPGIQPLAEYVRRAVIFGARDRDIGLVVTNSDGDEVRRAKLLDLMGGDAQERIVDPGEDVCRARLSDPASGEISDECAQAVDRWYRRV